LNDRYAEVALKDMRGWFLTFVWERRPVRAIDPKVRKTARTQGEKASHRSFLAWIDGLTL
jgi:hypothetical protein